MSQRILLRRVNWVTFAVAGPGLIGYPAIGAWGSFLAMLPLLAFSLSHLWLAVGSERFRVNVTLALILFAIAGGAATERPALMANLCWVAIVPIVATWLLDARAGRLWTAVSIATIAAVTVWLEVDPPPRFELASPQALQGVRFASLTIATWAFSAQAAKYNRALLADARAAEAAKTSFLANVSHEIRTPLNGVLGLTQVMLHRELQPRDREELELIARSGDTLLRLLNDLLDLTRGQQGLLQFEHIPFDLEVVLDDVRLLASGKPGVTVSRVGTVPHLVEGDPLRVRQVLLNLMMNARKFTERGTITLEARALDAGRWRFEVRDTGVGMTPEVLAKLFRPFQQADASIARRFGGSGLGLALVRSLVAGLNGTVGATSTAGRGSTFWVELPLPRATQPRPAPRVVRHEPLGANVLLVEDNEVNARVATAFLDRMGCTTRVSSSGESAVDRAHDERFDFVLMDLDLPGIDGLEAARRIHRHDPSLDIFALTASGDPADEQRVKNEGLVGLLPKPLVFEHLQQTLSDRLDLRRKARPDSEATAKLG